jgi:hypothetical protein
MKGNGHGKYRCIIEAHLSKGLCVAGAVSTDHPHKFALRSIQRDDAITRGELRCKLKRTRFVEVKGKNRMPVATLRMSSANVRGSGPGAERMAT